MNGRNCNKEDQFVPGLPDCSLGLDNHTPLRTPKRYDLCRSVFRRGVISAGPLYKIACKDRHVLWQIEKGKAVKGLEDVFVK